MDLEGQVRIPSGCAISGIFSKNGERSDGAAIITSIATMHDRSNGLGGGFAAYGIYPEHREEYAFHIFFNNQCAKDACEAYLLERYYMVAEEPIQVREIPQIKKAPIIWRYFIKPKEDKVVVSGGDEREFVAKTVFEINTCLTDTFVFSSGKNMGVFKAVGFPEDVGEYYRLEDYKGYSWTAHGRYPTNTPGWWGGAHPFALLDYSVVHNGEISSYDANRRFIEMFDYKCTLLTDTEVITYIVDYLVRRKGMTLQEAADIMAAPFWTTIEAMEDEKEKQRLTYLRNIYSSLLVTGPFSILVGFEGGMMALNDRLKLRSMVVGEKDDKVYIASEECAIFVLEPHLDRLWAPNGGEAVIVRLEGGQTTCR